MLRDVKFNTTANTSLSVTGLLVKKDDFLVAAKIIDNTGDTFTFPTGFVQVPGSPFATTFDAQQLAVATKVATVADEGASFTLNSANNGIGLVASYRDVYAPSPLDVAVVSSINNTGVASPFPIVVTGPQTIHDGCDLIWIAASDVNAGVDVVHTPPEGFLIRADIQGATVANFMNMAIADRIQRVHGPTGKLSGLGTAAGNSAAYAVVVLALRRKPVMPTRLRRPLSAAGGTQSYSYTAAGGLTLGGAATRAKGHVVAAAGGLQLGGASAGSRVRVQPAPAGGLLLGGTAAFAKGKTAAAAGGLSLAGAVLQMRVRAPAAAGGLVFGGAASVTTSGSQQFSYTATGGMQFGGAAVEVRVHAVLSLGGLQLGGAGALATHEAVRTVLASGGLQFGGSAAAQSQAVGGGTGGDIIRRRRLPR